MADEAWTLVSEQFSWEAITREFEAMLARRPRPGRINSAKPTVLKETGR